MVAASSEAARLLELFQLQSDQGPCLDCFRSGQPVACTDLSADPRWPQFAHEAGQAGFAAVQALPMRLRDQVIGALNLFRGTVGTFDPEVVHVGQALADVATISLLHDRSMRRTDTLNEQLQTALNSRVVIEQAGQARRAPWHRCQPGVHPAARPGPQPQPAAVRPRPCLRRRYPGHHRSRRHPANQSPRRRQAALDPASVTGPDHRPFPPRAVSARRHP